MRRSKWLVMIGSILCLTASVVYASSFTNVHGWNYTETYYYGKGEGQEGTAGDADINGEVGHPLYVSGPSGSCLPSHNWTLNMEVATGALPPGLEIVQVGGSDYGAIKGIPTKRGHWIVTMHAYNFTCDDKGYMGFTQQVRFHITGTGEVIQ